MSKKTKKPAALIPGEVKKSAPSVIPKVIHGLAAPRANLGPVDRIRQSLHLSPDVPDPAVLNEAADRLAQTKG